MKKIFIYLAGALGSILLMIYFGFLFIFPNVIDLTQYMPLVQQIVKEQANVDLSIENPKISTNWLLQAGIKTGKISAKLPDGSTILETDGIKVRISLPNLIFLTVKASCAEIKSPRINLEIANGEQFKFMSLIEDILNQKKNEPPKGTKPLPIDISKIKYKLVNAKITDYKVLVNDLKTGHTLTLEGDKLIGGYKHRELGKIKTIATISSDNEKKITAKLDLDSYIPPAREKDPDDDPAEKIEMPFLNPVLVYRSYDLKSDIDVNLKIRKEDKFKVKGYLIVDNATMTLSGYKLPNSFVNAKFKGEKAFIDTNLSIAKNQTINLFGKIWFGKDPMLDINLFTDRIYFNDMVILSKAILDTLHIKNNLSYIKAQGYWIARSNLKTDFEKLTSSGALIARDGKFSNGKTNLVLDDIKANLIFDDNKVNIVDTSVLVNGKALKAGGIIDNDTYSDIKVHSEKLPLDGLFQAFAPSDLKRAITLTSGAATIDANIKGELKRAVAYANIIVENLALRNSNAVVNNEKLVVGVVTDLKTIDGNIANKNLKITIPETNSTVQNQDLSVKLTEKNINIEPSNLIINSDSKIGFFGDIKNYSSNPNLKFIADGYLNAADIRKFLGVAAEPFIAATGNLPVKLQVMGDDKKQSVVLQLKSDDKNYITPVEIQSMFGKQSILQAKIDHKKDKLHIKQTGFYTGVKQFTDDLEANILNTQKIAEISGTIVKLNTDHPFINLIKLEIPQELQGKFTAFKHSSFKMNGGLIVFGRLASPIMRGDFKIADLRIPELLTSMQRCDLNLSGKNIILNISRLLLNGSDINITARGDINPHPVFTISRFDMHSNLIDVDKILKVPEALNKYLVKSNNSEESDIPLLIPNGSIDIKEIKSGNIKAENTTGRIALKNNILFLSNLDTHTFDGVINGDITVNLLSILIDIKTNGKGLNVEKALFDLANVKDAITGTMNFETDISINGATVEEMMKNLKGDVTFKIEDGQLGPFGKIENMILAENIRESQFFQTALGGVINNLASIDTSHFKTLDGLIKFENGIAHITPITTIGPVMSLFIAGDFDLLKNTTDMKVRAKLGSVIANMLGPLSQLNPINLVQSTPGLNVVMAKAFFLFCEQLTPEESAAIPSLESKLDDKMATKFQIVLRGDVSKPLKLIKSFKWLALSSEMEKAKSFVEALPDPSLVEDPNNATIEAIMQAQEAKAKEDAKLKNKVKRFFTKDN